MLTPSRRPRGSDPRWGAATRPADRHHVLSCRNGLFGPFQEGYDPLPPGREPGGSVRLGSPQTSWTAVQHPRTCTRGVGFLPATVPGPCRGFARSTSPRHHCTHAPDAGSPPPGGISAAAPLPESRLLDQVHQPLAQEPVHDTEQDRRQQYEQDCRSGSSL